MITSNFHTDRLCQLCKTNSEEFYEASLNLCVSPSSAATELDKTRRSTVHGTSGQAFPVKLSSAKHLQKHFVRVALGSREEFPILVM